ncbi:hypothetical protein POVWA2_047180 [Plasmodium ovale wallikeri]|uniref:Secreted protein n=1 Tax=Plasmodium ovale wallikeri TaxID=864142 RepID=A0A1A8ZJK7_PLAOA|nr:hypothetical protein POVWA1_048230 [Plasmodium ovale wallikeri]SBT44037.1 hypothetical protein POVWA2_047180 [Plasmodium ovale wallikeri]
MGQNCTRSVTCVCLCISCLPSPHVMGQHKKEKMGTKYKNGSTICVYSQMDDKGTYYSNEQFGGSLISKHVWGLILKACVYISRYPF